MIFDAWRINTPNAQPSDPLMGGLTERTHPTAIGERVWGGTPVGGPKGRVDHARRSSFRSLDWLSKS